MFFNFIFHALPMAKEDFNQVIRTYALNQTILIDGIHTNFANDILCLSDFLRAFYKK